MFLRRPVKSQTGEATCLREYRYQFRLPMLFHVKVSFMGTGQIR